MVPCFRFLFCFFRAQLTLVYRFQSKRTNSSPSKCLIFQSYFPTTVRDQRSFIFSQGSSYSRVIPTLIQPTLQGVLLQAQWHLLALPMPSLKRKTKGRTSGVGPSIQNTRLKSHDDTLYLIQSHMKSVSQ